MLDWCLSCSSVAWIIEWIAQELELEGLEEIMLAFVAKNYYFLTTDINEDGPYFTPGWGGAAILNSQGRICAVQMRKHNSKSFVDMDEIWCGA